MIWSDWVIEITNLAIGLGFCGGILLMNFPQHYLCWKHRSAEGLSLAYILICTISNVTLTLASLMGDYEDIASLVTSMATNSSATTAVDTSLYLNNESTFFENKNGMSTAVRSLLSKNDENTSFSTLIGIVKILNACMPTIQNTLSIFVWVPSLLVYFFLWEKPLPEALPIDEQVTRPASQEPLLSPATPQFETTPPASSEQEIAQVESRHPPRYYYSDGTESRLGKISTVLVWLVVIFAIALSAGVLWTQNTVLEVQMLEIWGCTAAVTNMILFIPQIITTWRNQHEGVLSLISLLVSVIGDVAMAAFWIVSDDESIWVYASCAADAGMQLILIVMIIDFRKKRFVRERQRDISGIIRGTYSFVHNNGGEDGDDDDDDDYSGLGYKGEIEVVYGEIFEVYSSAATAVEWFWESPIMVSMMSGSFDAAEVPP